jgi:hypothetical protein
MSTSVTIIQTPTLVRNTKLGPTVFTDPETKTEITWQGANDPMGDDVQVVPPGILGSSDFLRCLTRGIFVIESAPDDVRAQLEAHLNQPRLRRQAEQWQAQQDQGRETSLATVEVVNQNDIVAVPCIGPATRGEGLCGADIPVRESAKGDKAPLCGQHEMLASQYVPTEDGNWVRVRQAPRQQFQSIHE